MTPDPHPDSPSAQAPSQPTPPDDFLVAGLLGGDAAALRKLMERYDRLVRYTVFRLARDRCRRDPQWLDTVASDTWTGFVQSVRRDPENRPKSIRAYLVRVARNRTISALRRDAGDREPAGVEIDADLTPSLLAPDEPLEHLAELELLEALRGCLAELDADGRGMASQLEAITERRWRDAAGALGVKESTLRSRWKQVLARLRRCLQRKIEKNVAPLEFRGDLIDEGEGSVRENGQV